MKVRASLGRAARLAALALAACALAACKDPDFGDGHLQCATSGRACPSGFYCAADAHCWRNGSGPGGGDMSGEAGDLASAPDMAGASKCAGLAVKLCDGFEAAALDAKWVKNLNAGTVTLDTTRAFRGQSSVHLHTNSVTGGMGFVDAVIYTAAPFPITTTAWARAWFYFKSQQPNATAQVINFLDNMSTGAAYVMESGGHPGINDYAIPQSYTASAAMQIPFDRWTCLVMQLPQSGATGDINIFIDGTKVDVTLTGATTTAMNRVAFGLDYYMPPAINAADAWLDEVIVDDKPVSCTD